MGKKRASSPYNALRIVEFRIKGGFTLKLRASPPKGVYNVKSRLITVILLALVILTLAAFAPFLQSQRFAYVITRKLLVQEGGATFNSGVVFNDAVTLTGNTTQTGDVALTGDLTLNGNFAGRSLFLQYQDVAAAPSIYAAAEVVSTTNSITTSILGIDTPRNAVVVLESDLQRAAGNITLAGIDARGNAATEILAMTAITDAETLTGNVPWVSITSFTIPAQTNSFTLTVTGGQKFGLPLVPQAAGDLYHLTVAATPQAAPTVNATYGTFDPVATPAAGVDYDVWLKQ